MEPELLPLVQSEVILFLQVNNAVKFTWPSVCWEAGPASLSAMQEPVSISFPFNPGAWLPSPCSTHKSGVSTPRLQFPVVFQQSQAVLQEEARYGVGKGVFAQKCSSTRGAQGLRALDKVLYQAASCSLLDPPE